MSGKARRARTRQLSAPKPGNEPRAAFSLRRGCIRIDFLHLAEPQYVEAKVVGRGREKVRFRPDEVLSRFTTGQLLAEIERRIARDDTAVFVDYLLARGDTWGKAIAEFIAHRSAKRRPKITEPQ